MFELLLIGLVISVPVFYIYGIISLFRRKPSGSRQEIIAELFRASVHAKQSKEKEAYEIAANYLKGGPSYTPATVQTTKNEPEKASLAEGASPTKSATITSHQSSAQSPFHSLDNINLLLYLGAFLVIVACGIFANYSYASLTGLMKTMAMVSFAAAFYGTGLFMYKASEKVRPAAVVFTAIGLLAFPLVGVVAYKFWLTQSYFEVIWFVTSLKCMILYLIAFKVIRHQLLEYLSVFTALSLFQSTIGLFELPVHYYYWGFCVFSLIGLAFEKTKPLRFQSKALFFTSQILIPISLFISLFDLFAQDMSFLEAGVTFGLATLYYGLLSEVSEKVEEKKMYLFLSGLGLPTSVALIWRQFLPEFMRPEIGFSILVISLVYAQLSEMFSWKKDTVKQQLFAVLSGVIAVAASVLTVDYHRFNLFMLASSMGVNLFLLFRTKERLLLIFYAVSVFIIPYPISQLFPALQKDVYISSMYLSTLLVFIPFRKLILSLRESKEMLGFMYFLSCAATFFFVSFSYDKETFIILLLLPLVIFLLTFYEKVHQLAFLPILLIYFAIFRLEAIFHVDQYVQGLLFLASGIGFYTVSYLSIGPRKPQVMMMGMLGTGLAFLWMYDYNPKYLSPVSLITLGGLISVESVRQKSQAVLKTGIAVMLAGIQFGLANVFKIEEVQVYTISWSAYILWLSFTAKEKDKDGYYALSMALLTIPLGIEALEKQLKGLLLILEGIGLVLVGIQFRKKIVWQWGTGVLILEVLYYMREFLLNLPTWAIFGGLGLILLAGSVLLLMQRKPSQE